MNVDVGLQVKNMLQREHPLSLHRAMLLGAQATTPSDALVDFFAGDEVIREMEVDAEARMQSYVKGCLWFSLVCPCFLPHQLITCSPCSLCFLLPERTKANAAANHLVLKKTCLSYVLDECLLPSSQPGSPIVPICMSCVSLSVPRIEFCLPLSSDIQFEIIPPSENACATGTWYPIPTLLVKSMGMVVAAIDAPVDADGFIAAVRAQQKRFAPQQQAVAFPASVWSEHVRFLTLLGSASSLGPMMIQRLLAHRDSSQSAASAARRQMILQQALASMQAEETAAFQAAANQQQSGRPIAAEMIRSGLAEMSVADVCAALKSMGLEHHCAAFEKAGIDGPTAQRLNEASLMELGVTESALERARILGWIAKIGDSYGASSALAQQ